MAPGLSLRLCCSGVAAPAGVRTVLDTECQAVQLAVWISLRRGRGWYLIVHVGRLKFSLCRTWSTLSRQDIQIAYRYLL